MVVTLYGLSALRFSQGTADTKEIAVRALLDIKASAISTIMLDPSLVETKVVFADAESNIERQSKLMDSLHLPPQQMNLFSNTLRQWQEYDQASQRLINADGVDAIPVRESLRQLYHQSFEPFEISIEQLSYNLIRDAENAKKSSKEHTALVYWVLLPLLTLISIVVGGLVVVMQQRGERTSGILNTVVEAVVEINEHGQIQDINPAGELMFGYRKTELLGRNISILMPEPYQSNHDQYIHKYLESGHANVIGIAREAHAKRKNGASFPIEISVGEARQGRHRFFIGIIKDITARKLIEIEQRIAAIAFETQEGILITDADKRIIRVNQAFTKITGYSAYEVIGLKPSILKSGKHDRSFYECMNATLDKDGTWKGEIWNRKKDGQLYPEWLTITTVKDDAGLTTNYVGTIADISEHKQAEAIMKSMAFQDPLTHLANRRLITSRTEQALAASKRSKSYGALFYLDIDNFKSLNDTMGHHHGDLLLCEVASRLKGCVRTEDTVARLGGDEFAILVEHLSDNLEVSINMARGIGEKIVLALREPYVLEGSHHQSSASVGVALLHGNYSQLETLISEADAAMYVVKKAGRNSYHLAATFSTST